MKIVVLGGSGLIRKKLVTSLQNLGHDAVAASPSSGVNALTGEGLADVLVNADVVVDVTNFKPETWLDGAGNFHGSKLHVVERYTRTNANTIHYEATIEDPEVFERPWKIRVDLARHTEPNFQLVEHECERDAQGVYRHPPQFLK